MRTQLRSMRTAHLTTAAIRWVSIFTIVALGSLAAQERKFYPDDPLPVDYDTLDVPERPEEIDLSDMFDRFGHIMADLGSRQRKTARHYLNRLNPIDRFVLEGDALMFRNLSEDSGFAEPGAVYRVQWSVYDDATGSRTGIGSESESASTRIALPDAARVTVGSVKFLVAEIRAVHDNHPMWNRRVTVYLRPVGGGFEVVGVERESDSPDLMM